MSTGSMRQYDWPGKHTPYDHQVKTAEFVVGNPRCFVLNAMGTGKSASLLWAADHLMSEGKVRQMLIIAPLSTLNRVWRDEAFRLLMHRNVVVLQGSAAKRRELYAQDWDIAIINFDGIPVLKDELLADARSGRLNMIAIDEAAGYRNAGTKRFSLTQSITTHVERLILMTGTPCPESPTDAWGLATLLENSLAPRFFGAWRRATMIQRSQHKWIPQADGFEKAFTILQPAIRFRKEDCLDLPPVTTEDWEVEMTAEQKIAYKAMVREMAVDFAKEGEQLRAVNAADKVNKLRQIACGVVRDTETGEYVLLDHAPRLAATLAAIEHAAAKVIVVVPFKGIINQLAQEAGEHYSVAVINGDVSSKARDDVVTRFRETPDPHVLLVHPRVMAHGLTLVEADVMVFYGPIYSNEESKQIVERINRPGQTRNMTVIRLGATTLEWSIYERVRDKAAGEDALLELYKNAMSERI